MEEWIILFQRHLDMVDVLLNQMEDETLQFDMSDADIDSKNAPLCQL